MATLAVQAVSLSGIAPNYVAVEAGGDAFPNDGRTYVQIANGSIFDSLTISFAPQATEQGVSFETPAVVLTPGAIKVAGPFPTRVFNDGSAMVQMSYAGNSPAAALTVDIFRVG